MTSARRFWLRLLSSPTFYAIVVVLMLGWLLSSWLALHDLQTIRESYGPAAAWITVPIHVSLALTPFPSDLILIANGAVYGLVVGTLLSWLGSWFAAILQFSLGCRVRTDFDLAGQSDRLPRWLRQLPFEHPLYLIGIRQVPLLGMHIGSFVPGAAGVPLKRFAWCSALGTFPGSLLMTAIGAGVVYRFF